MLEVYPYILISETCYLNRANKELEMTQILRNLQKVFKYAITVSRTFFYKVTLVRTVT